MHTLFAHYVANEIFMSQLIQGQETMLISFAHCADNQTFMSLIKRLYKKNT